MNRSLRLRLPVVAAAVTASLVAAGCGSSGSSGSGGAAAASVPGITNTQILIGSHQPLTGPAAPGYSEIAPAANAYFQYVNAHGGIYGRKIKYTYLDDGYDPSKTVTVVHQLVLQDNVFAIFNGLGTPTHLAVVKYLNGAQGARPVRRVGLRLLEQPDDLPVHVRLAARLRARGQDPRRVHQAALRGQEDRLLLPERRVRPGRRQGPGLWRSRPPRW